MSSDRAPERRSTFNHVTALERPQVRHVQPQSPRPQRSASVALIPAHPPPVKVSLRLTSPAANVTYIAHLLQPMPQVCALNRYQPTSRTTYISCQSSRRSSGPNLTQTRTLLPYDFPSFFCKLSYVFLLIFRSEFPLSLFYIPFFT